VHFKWLCASANEANLGQWILLLIVGKSLNSGLDDVERGRELSLVDLEEEGHKWLEEHSGLVGASGKGIGPLLHQAEVFGIVF
jgi:hypothetical protein